MTSADPRPPRNLLKRIRALRLKKGREESGTFLTEGRKLIQEAERAGLRRIHLLLSESAKDFRNSHFLRTPREIFILPDSEFEKIAATESPQGVLAEYEIPPNPSIDTLTPSSQPILILDEIQDPGNVGTAIRSAAALGGSAVLLTEGCADIWNPKTVRASAGAAFHLPLVQGLTIDQAMDWLSKNRIRTLLASANGGCLHDFHLPRSPVAIVLGNESRGPNPKWRTQFGAEEIGLPMERGMDSLNVGVTAAIFLALLREKQIQSQ
jgi:TrmH family RNA methyltransferase